MEPPVSAFAVYKSNNTPKQNNKKRKRKQKSQQKHKLPPHIEISNKKITDLSEKLAREIGQKLKKNTKRKNKGIKKKDQKNKKISKVNVINDNIVAKPVNEGITTVEPCSETSTPTLILATPEHEIVNGSESSFESFEFTPVNSHSKKEGVRCIEWVISPYGFDKFFKNTWERTPLHVARGNRDYYKTLISTPMIDEMLRKQNILFTKNIDITSYTDGQRETHNPVGRAHPHVVWDYYLNGCSIRLLNPQTFIPKLHFLNATLQELFHSFVGANVYLTPPDSQGFAPHYDDIEAFILQVEGKKHWRIYKPCSAYDTLPRVSSRNFNQDEIGEPMLEVTLNAGDMLYFPRGYIHQAVTIDGEHSLHITLSMYQKHTWADLFEKMLPVALQNAINENVEFRYGLPFGIYDNFGAVNNGVQTNERIEFQNIIKTLFKSIKHHLPIDAAVDEMSKQYYADALPPVLTDAEKSVTVYGDFGIMVDGKIVKNRVEIELDTRIRLLRKNILRCVTEEDCTKIYYYTENSLEYHAQELQFLEIGEDLAPAIVSLIEAYPEYINVEDLDISDDSDKIQVASDLWEKGIIMTEYPMQTIDDD